jgi:hypothetical protein
METEGSLPHSQEPATCLYPEPYQSSPCPPSHFLIYQSDTAKIPEDVIRMSLTA